MKYSKSPPSGTFDWGAYIQFTLLAGKYSIDNFNVKIKTAVLGQKEKNGTRLKAKTLASDARKLCIHRRQ